MTARMIYTAVAALVISAASASMAFAQSEPEVDCDSPTTQADMNFCAASDYETADEELNTEYQSVRKVLAERDSSAGEDGEGAVKALLAAQRAWIAYRDANCDAVGFQARGGSMEPLLVSSCLADMSRKRTEELRSLSEGF